MDPRDEMVAVVSHDLKNPLATIQLAVGLLLEELVPDDAAHATIRKPLDAIRHTTEDMRRLIHDLLDLGATEARGFSLCRSREVVGVLIQEAIESVEALARVKQISLVADVPSDLPGLDVDRWRVSQIFSNLLGNAIKFSPAAGRVVVSARFGGDSFVAFTVSDQGPGIAPADLPYVFDRYWQVGKKRRGDVGLGLAIAKAIVVAHGGYISAQSAPGQGSQFSFALPACAIGPKS
jgi:signal transduction histidine kinase